MWLTKQGIVKLIDFVLIATGTVVFVIQQYLIDYRPELAQNTLYIISFALFVSAYVFYAIAMKLIKRNKK
jgi:hypothetical protein